MNNDNKNESKFYLEIPLHDGQPGYDFSYELLIAEGDSLQECLMNAIVTIVDAKGSTIDIIPADAHWMQQLVEQEFRDLYLKPNLRIIKNH